MSVDAVTILSHGFLTVPVAGTNHNITVTETTLVVGDD